MFTINQLCGSKAGSRPDLIDLLFLGSSCTLIIKKNWKQIKQTDFFFLVNSFSKKSLHSHTFFFFLPVFCFIFIPIEINLGKIQLTTHQLSLA